MMNNLEQNGSPSRDKDIQWVTLSQNSSGDWTPSGPFKTFEVRQKMEAGLLKPTDYCWQSGWSDWKRIFDEPSFYHSRKPPIEIPTVKKETVEFRDTEVLSPRPEIAEKIKKVSSRKKTVKTMLEPWETPQKAIAPEETTKTEVQMDVPPELSPESLKTMQTEIDEQDKTQVRPFWKRKSVVALAIIAFTAALVLDILFKGQIYQMFMPAEPQLVASFVSVSDYSAETPRHLIARSDLKKGEDLIVRVLNMNEKPLKTIKGGDGLKIPSKGTGQIRIPLYPYDLPQGSYKILVRAGEAEVLKAFIIPDNANLSKSLNSDSSKSVGR